MRHLLHATKRELQKLGHAVSAKSDFAPELTVVAGASPRSGA